MACRSDPTSPGSGAAGEVAQKVRPAAGLVQIEMCEWAVKRVQDASEGAEKPKREFVAAVGKEVESLKKHRKPVIDPSEWASPMCTEYWKFY